MMKRLFLVTLLLTGTFMVGLTVLIGFLLSDIPPGVAKDLALQGYASAWFRSMVVCVGLNIAVLCAWFIANGATRRA